MHPDQMLQHIKNMYEVRRNRRASFHGQEIITTDFRFWVAHQRHSPFRIDTIQKQEWEDLYTKLYITIKNWLDHVIVQFFSTVCLQNWENGSTPTAMCVKLLTPSGIDFMSLYLGQMYKITVLIVSETCESIELYFI